MPAALTPFAATMAAPTHFATTPAAPTPFVDTTSILKPFADMPATLTPFAAMPQALTPFATTPTTLKPFAATTTAPTPFADMPATLTSFATTPATLKPFAATTTAPTPFADMPATLTSFATTPATLKPFAATPATLTPFAATTATPTPFADTPATPTPFAATTAAPTPFAATPATPTLFAATPATPTTIAATPEAMGAVSCHVIKCRIISGRSDCGATISYAGGSSACRAYLFYQKHAPVMVRCRQLMPAQASMPGRFNLAYGLCPAARPNAYWLRRGAATFRSSYAALRHTRMGLGIGLCRRIKARPFHHANICHSLDQSHRTILAKSPAASSRAACAVSQANLLYARRRGRVAHKRPPLT